MTLSNLQRNLKGFIERGNHQIFELERQAGVRKNNVYNILNGLSRKPSAETLQAICNILKISIEDLYAENIQPTRYLEEIDYTLIEQIIKTLCAEIKLSNLKVSGNEFLCIGKEIFKYLSSSAESYNNEADNSKLIKLMLRLKFQKK